MKRGGCGGWRGEVGRWRGSEGRIEGSRLGGWEGVKNKGNAIVSYRRLNGYEY